MTAQDRPPLARRGDSAMMANARAVGRSIRFFGGIGMTIFLRSGSRRIALAGAAATLLLTTAAQAALPPYWQRVREIQAILDDGDVGRALREAPIDRIERIAEDRYQVQAGPCTLEIRVIGESRSDPGPRKFHLEAGAATCR